MSTDTPVSYPPSQGGYVAPSGYSLEQNITQAQQVFSSLSANDAWLWFFDQVRPGGPWDYKRIDDGSGNNYEGIGNFNYGAVGHAVGIPDEVLQKMPGFFQEAKKPEWGTPFGGPPYGDDPLDQKQINKGIQWARENVPSLPESIPDPFIFPQFAEKMMNEWFRRKTISLSETLNDLWNRARSWIRRDPLALDLDGDGLETVGATGSNVVLFDHDGDGIRTGTGWVKADDGLLVLDKNANGLIDNGAELFGVDTILANGQKAANGFAALADLDTNHDGVFNSNDAAYTQVRLWQDANQDGVSQAAELKTLAALGITAINLNAVAANQALAGGNVLDLQSTTTKADGSSGTAGALNLVDNPFYRQYPDGSVETLDNPFNQPTSGGTVLTPEAQALPDMKGSGAVRDLREAASLDGGLAARVQTRASLMGSLDGVIDQWAGTSGFTLSQDQADAKGYRLIYMPQGMSWEEGLGYIPNTGTNGGMASPEQIAHLAAMQARQSHVMHLLGVLERFNGMGFVNRAANDVEWREWA